MSAESEPLLPRTALFAPMDAHVVVKVSGPDAAALLQGQLSNDVEALVENPGQLSSFNSPKGRVLAFLRVLKHDDAYWLVVDRAVHDAFLQRLKMFVLRSKVNIEAAPELAGLVVAGPDAPAQLKAAGLPSPAPGIAITHDGKVYLGIPGTMPRIEIFGAHAHLPALPMEPASGDALACWDILFHLPRIMEGNRDAHVAQHLGLDDLGAINFRKGCYTGQEIIARMKYLGKVKKGPAVLAGAGANVGDAIRTVDDRGAGEVVNVAAHGEEQLVLAVLNHDQLDPPLFVDGNPFRKI